MEWSPGFVVATFVASFVSCSLLAGQETAPCTPHWDDDFAASGTDAWVYTLEVLPWKGEKQVFAGGYFNRAGHAEAKGVARWDGFNWHGFGEGIDGLVMAIASFDDGSGPSIYAGGLFQGSGGRSLSNIARWDEDRGRWVDVGGGVDDAVINMVVHDDGSGPALFVGGTFKSAGEVEGTSHLARWDGHAWSSVGGGMDGAVRAMKTYEDGGESALYVGGLFSRAGRVTAGRVARWDGSRWSALGEGLDGSGVRTMAIYHDVHGPALYVGGLFMPRVDARSKNLARWDLTEEKWSGLGTGTNERVVAMTTFDDGRGERLYIGGWFTTMNDRPVDRLVSWNGEEGARFGGEGASFVVRAFAVYPDPLTRRISLFVGGGFREMDGRPAHHIARWVGCCDAAE